MQLHIGVFSYYYLPVVNGVTITIEDWRRSGQTCGQATFSFVRVPSLPLRLDPRVNVLHAHHPFAVGGSALWYKRRRGLPLVFTYHTRYTDYAATYLPFLPRRLTLRWVNRSVVSFCNACDAVTAANETLKRELTQAGVTTAINIVPPGVDTAAFARGSGPRARRRWGIHARETVLLTVGRLAKEKNLSFLLDAYHAISRRHPNVRLVLAGRGSEEESLRARAGRLGLTQRVTFATSESLSTMPDVYQAADAFVYASQTETYGRVVVEAMAAGLPIVALGGPGIDDIIEDGRTGRRVSERSAQAFAGAVLETLGDASRARALGRRAREKARRAFDSAVSWHLLYEVYSGLVHTAQ